MAADIKLFRATSKVFEYQHTNPETDEAESLVGCTLYFTVKRVEWDKTDNDSSAVITKTVLPDEHTDAAGGLSGFLLTDVDMKQDPGDYFYSVIVEDAEGRADPPSLYGKFTIKAHPTNRQVLNG